MKKLSISFEVEVEDDVDVEDFIQIAVNDHFDLYSDDARVSLVADKAPTAQEIMDSPIPIRYKGFDITYNPYMNHGEIQIFRADSDHTEYMAWKIVDGSIGGMIQFIDGQANSLLLYNKYKDNYDLSDAAEWMTEAVPETSTDIIEEMYEAEYGEELNEQEDFIEDPKYQVIVNAFWMMIKDEICTDR